MPLTFVKSERGNDKLAHAGYLYCKDKNNWRCDKKGCKGRVKANGDQVEVINGDHTCAIDPAGVQAAITMSQIKNRAVTTQETTRQIVAQCTATLGDEAKTKLGKYNSIQRQIERSRIRENMPYPNPQSLAEIQIPPVLSVTKNGDQFLFYDSGAEDRERIFIFTTASNIRNLKDYPHWCIDGTFKVAPHLFYQLWMIHGIVHNAVLPLVYVLMTGKSQALYTHTGV